MLEREPGLPTRHKISKTNAVIHSIMGPTSCCPPDHVHVRSRPD